jgi:Helix-turn-helix domain
MAHDMETQNLHSFPEAAKLLGGISVWTLRKHVWRGNVTVIRIGRRVFITSEEIDRIRQEGLPSLADGRSASEVVRR